MIQMPPESLNLVTPLSLQAPQFTLFFLVNLLSLLGVLIYSASRFISNNLVCGRLYFCFAVLICFFYQLPLTFFSAQVEAGLRNPWAYSLIVNGSACLLLIYGSFSKSFDLKFLELSLPQRLPEVYFLTLIFAILSLFSYFLAVPWSCTALYALMYDPWLTLLAREFGVKLIGTSIATYSFGAYANAIAPILVLVSIWLYRVLKRSWQGLGLLLGATTGIAAIVAVLISGTKGLLIPLLIMLLAGAYFWSRTWRMRIVSMLLSITFVLSCLIGFELFKERSSVIGAKYDFAICSSNAGKCYESLELLDSMKHRDYSLGLPYMFLEPIRERLVCLCDKPSSIDLCPSGSEDRSGLLGLSGAAERSATFAGALLNRIFVVPFQVSVWNFMYAETESFDGWQTLPFSKRIIGVSINMPELVYQKYGSIYSQGDKTSTSTAPTSFFIAYPAFIGLYGFLLSIICIILLDFFVAKLAVSAGPSLAPIVVGTVLIMTMNFMTSDFVTVLISHGGAIAILLLGIFTLLIKIKK